MILIILIELIIFMVIIFIFKSRSYLYFLINFFFFIISLSLIILYFGIEFLTFMLILVYAGAVIILFLFVVMLFDGDIVNYNKQSYIKLYCIFVIVEVCIWVCMNDYNECISKYDIYLNYCDNILFTEYYFNVSDVLCNNEDEITKELENNVVGYDLSFYFWLFFQLMKKVYLYYEIDISQDYFINNKMCEYINFNYDENLFNIVSIYLFNNCYFEFYIMSLLLFICLVSTGVLLRMNIKNKIKGIYNKKRYNKK